MGRQRVLLDWLRIDPGEPEPIYRQIAEQLAAAILRGYLAAGDVLPSSRGLASTLGVSRITTLRAYDQLIAEELVEAFAGSGTRVKDARDMTGDAATGSGRPAVFRAAPHTSGSPQNLAEGQPAVLAFHPGLPAFDRFPRTLWARLLRRHGGRADQFILDYAHPGGYAPLRASIARYLMASRGVVCTPGQIVVVTSARAALHLIVGQLAPPGSAIAMEDPGWVRGRRSLMRTQHPIVPVPVDREGVRVDRLAAGPERPRLMLVTAGHQWPTGVTLSAQRRLELLDWARRNEAHVIEDDHDSEFRYGTPPLPTLYALARGERVVYVGTFAKTLAPSIRCAFLVVPEEHIRTFVEAAFLSGCEPSLHLQAALSDLIAEGHFVRHIAAMRKTYRRRRDALIEALDRCFGGQVAIDPPPGGLQLVARLPGGVSPTAFSRRAAGVDLLARPMAVYCTRARPANALHLGFAALPEPAIGPATRRLAAATTTLF